jgi:HPr kinase/phosphorylase
MTSGTPARQVTGVSNIHATAVVIEHDGVAHGILIEGGAQSGKTTLAFTLIEDAELRGRGAAFVSDDRTDISNEGGRLIARAPASIAGLAELAGFGIITVRSVPSAAIDLVVRVTGEGGAGSGVVRLPEPETVTLAGVTLPLLRVPGRASSIAARIVRAQLSLLAANRAAPTQG